LKKIISILLIAVFFTAQYARQLAYIECKLAALDTAALSCDCEKETGIDKAGDNSIPAPKAHTHISIDEFFNSPVTKTENIATAIVLCKPVAVYAQKESTGAGNSIYHPPRV
jgi:hypothetical protein